MKEEWIVFRDGPGRELCRVTVKGTFTGEIQATKELLAYEKGIDPEEISVTVETEKKGA